MSTWNPSCLSSSAKKIWHSRSAVGGSPLFSEVVLNFMISLVNLATLFCLLSTTETSFSNITSDIGKFIFLRYVMSIVDGKILFRKRGYFKPCKLQANELRKSDADKLTQISQIDE